MYEIGRISKKQTLDLLINIGIMRLFGPPFHACDALHIFFSFFVVLPFYRYKSDYGLYGLLLVIKLHGEVIL